MDSQGRIMMSAQQVAILAADPILGGKTVVPYADFAQAVRHSRGKNEPDVTYKKTLAFPARSFLLGWPSALAIVLFFAVLARAGGPEYVAGSSYFNSGTMGQPITWSLGQVNYYTDQGDLSPILPNASANALVANAFSQWTSVSTAALTATNAGQLAEDVNGSNIARQLQRKRHRTRRYHSLSHANSGGNRLRLRRLGHGRPARRGRGRSLAMLLERRLRRRGQLRCRREFSARAGGHQRPVRAAVVATHRRRIPAGASAR